MLNPPTSPENNDHKAQSCDETQIQSLHTPSALPGPKASAATSSIDWVGRKLGKYRVTGILGRGGMGIVLKAHDDLIDRDVAIKLLPEEFAANETSLNRFLTEARAAGRLSHPNIVGIYEVGQEGSSLFLVMELVPGGSIDDQLSRGVPYPPLAATRIILDACRGLEAAHAQGMVHRDIKPANLLRSQDGRVKVTDFGIVKDRAGTSSVTMAGNVVGTPYYMSPEQCSGGTVDPRSDVYSLGATYYSLLTGENPYQDSKSAIHVMFAHCNQPPPSPRKADASIPLGCEAIVQKAMAKNPADRYQSVAEMAIDLNILQNTLTDGDLLARTGLNQERLAALLTSQNQKAAIQAAPVVNRRSFLAGAGMLAGGALLAGGFGAAFWATRKPSGVIPPVAADSADPIKIGILHSLSGTMASSEGPVVDALMLAIDEINAEGGLLGRRLEPVLADGKSKENVFAAEARRLIEQEKVCTVFGGWTSASRKSMKPVIEELDHLLIYPLQYEGLESSPNIVYMGAAPNQQILPAIEWAQTALGKKKFFLVGSDYVFPRSANAIIRDSLKAHPDAEIVGESYLPLGTPYVEKVVAQIVQTQPDMILNTINGDTNISFFRELRANGITPQKIPTLSFSIGESELRNFDLKSMQGDYAAWNYFQTIDSEDNRKFLEKLKAKYPQRVATDPIESSYVGMKLWAQAVREAGQLEPKLIRRALVTQRWPNAPQGPVRIDPESQHCYKTPRVGQIRDDGQFDIVWTGSEPVAPDAYPATRSAEDWKAFLHDLHSSWGGHWSAQSM